MFWTIKTRKMTDEDFHNVMEKTSKNFKLFLLFCFLMPFITVILVTFYFKYQTLIEKSFIWNL